MRANAHRPATADLEPMGPRRRLDRRPRATAIAALTTAVAAIVALFELERSVATMRSVDAHILRFGAERIAISGDSFYVAAADHKGPLWIGLYRLAFTVTSDQATYWFVIAAMALAVAVTTGAAVAAALPQGGAPRATSLGGGAAIALFLALGPGQYSDVLYSRNITTLLLSVTFACSASMARARRDRLAARAVVGGLAAGLAAQTVPPEIFTGTALIALGGVVALTRPDVTRRFAIRLCGYGYTAAVLAGISAPVWYVLRGDFGDFWSLWWDYNQRYTDATARSDLEIVVHGIDAAVTHHIPHPLMLVALGGFVSTTVRRRTDLSRAQLAVRVGVLAWWGSSLAGLIAAQRFFEHYWVVAVVPVLAACSLAVGDLFELLPRRRLAIAAIPLVLLIGTVAPRAALGAELAVGFRGFEAHHERQLVGDTPPDILVQRAVVSAFAGPGEPVLVWSRNGFAQIIVDRPSPTRYTPDWWFTGIVPGARRIVPVLPDVWENFVADMGVDPPRMIVVQHSHAVPDGSPLERMLRDDYIDIGTMGFREEPDATFHLRRDLDAVPATVGAPAASMIGAGTGGVDPPALAVAPCTTLVTRVRLGSRSALVVAADDDGRSVRLDASGGSTVVADRVVATTHGDPGGEWIDLAIVTGRDHVTVVADGRIAGAVTTRRAALDVELAAVNGALELRDPRLVPTPTCR